MKLFCGMKIADTVVAHQSSVFFSVLISRGEKTNRRYFTPRKAGKSRLNVTAASTVLVKEHHCPLLSSSSGSFSFAEQDQKKRFRLCQEITIFEILDLCDI